MSEKVEQLSYKIYELLKEEPFELSKNVLCGQLQRIIGDETQNQLKPSLKLALKFYSDLTDRIYAICELSK